MTYIVVSENEIVKAEMAVPDCWGWSGPNPVECKKCIKFQAHCLSLPRIPIEGKHKWEVWQSVEKGKDFIFIERCCEEFHVLGVSECESSDDDDNPCKCSVAIPIQPTQNKIVKEDMICPETGKYCDDECCTVGSICNVSESTDGISPQPTPEGEKVEEWLPRTEFLLHDIKRIEGKIINWYKKNHYSQGDSYSVRVTKKGKWAVSYSNDYPMQHGGGQEYVLSEEDFINATTHQR